VLWVECSIFPSPLLTRITLLQTEPSSVHLSCGGSPTPVSPYIIAHPSQESTCAGSRCAPPAQWRPFLAVMWTCWAGRHVAENRMHLLVTTSVWC
jgi:hypothetical protein